MNQSPPLAIKILVPFLILGTLAAIAFLISNNPPEASRRGGGDGPRLVVETLTLIPTDYTVQLASYGVVQPRTRSVLVSQVGGQIVELNPAFRDGGFFSAGDVLVRIDPRDYDADVDIARATLLDARQALAEAEARREQALADWAALGNAGEPPPLVGREPQLNAARARVASAAANLRKANLALERTEVVAPYDGRVLTQSADIGQVVSANAVLGEVYATDAVEVRLPLRDRDLPFAQLPEQFADGATRGDRATVTLVSDLGDGARWTGRVVRTEGAIDSDARQLHVVAQLDDPYALDDLNAAPVKIGQYVSAAIEGRTVEEALIVPNNVIYQGTFVFVVRDGILDRRRIEVVWQNDIESLVSDGVLPGEQVVTTQLGQVTTGTRVEVVDSLRRDRREASQQPAGASPAESARR